MALPSSPPPAPDHSDQAEDIPSSPPLLPLPATSRQSQARKRPYSDYGSQSSDPIFSDATSDAEQLPLADNNRHTKKRFVRGPWWQLRRRSTKSRKPASLIKPRAFRNADSGVWMGSDEDITNSDDSLPGVDNVLPSLRLQSVLGQHESLSVEIDAVREPESLAVKLIHNCLEQGSEKVDLSDLALRSLSSATLRPLHQLIRSSHADRTLPPSEDEFSPLTPSLQLFLSRNTLASLPSELFDLINITVLSLRNNALESIPAAIGRLTHLKELNIAGNHLTFLPWELLDLMSPADGRQITVRPNPLVSPTDLSGPSPLSRTDAAGLRGEEFGRYADTRATYQHLRKLHLEQGNLNERGELELRLKLGRMLRTQALQEASRAGKEVKVGRHELIYLASSRIRYLDIGGSPFRHTLASDLTQTPCWTSCVDDDRSHPDRVTASPSLFEGVLRSLQRNFDLRGPVPEGLPPSIAGAWRQAAANVEQGYNSACSTCGRGYIVPRAVWMEFYFHGFGSQDSLSTETVLPFLRKACSWACATPSEAGEFRL